MRERAGVAWWVGLAALAALLLPVFVIPPVPIDETRYLAVAWNMHLSGQWLVPHLDGAVYPDKPPLLFWLINATWALTGVHAWSARLLELALGLATLPLLAVVVRELGGTRDTARTAGWLWLGCAAFAGFAGAVMFDMLLTVCTLLAWWGSTRLVRGRTAQGTLLLALGLGLGILAKGPVSLLVGVWPALLAPWWSPLRVRPWPHYAGVFAALVLAAALALAWAIPAARAGGPAYADAIFLRQTAGRVVESFAHQRGPLWYVPIVPLLLLPWAVSLGRGAAAAVEPMRRSLDRFALAAVVPPFLAFCAISGKQPHYLLPLLPALAVAAGGRLAAGNWRVVAWRVGATLAVIGAGFFAALGRLAPGAPWLAHAALGAVLLLGLGLVLRGPATLRPGRAATAMLVTVALAKLAFIQALGPRYSVQPTATRLAAAQRAGRPLLQAGEQHGLYTFAGRLRQPIPTARDDAEVARWAARHPDGWVISSYGNFDFQATPLFRQPYLGRRLAIWRAAAIVDEARLAAREDRSRARATAALGE